MSKKTKAQELQEQLTHSPFILEKDAPDHKEKAFKYCEGYKKFLNAGKTERDCVKEAVHMLKSGCQPFLAVLLYEPEDKVYYKPQQGYYRNYILAKSRYQKACILMEPTLTPQDWADVRAPGYSRTGDAVSAILMDARHKRWGRSRG